MSSDVYERCVMLRKLLQSPPAPAASCAADLEADADAINHADVQM